MDSSTSEISITEMNQVCFNELSTYPLCFSEGDADVRILLYVQTLKEAVSHGIKRVRYSDDLTSVPLTDSLSLQDYCNTRMRSERVQLIMSMASKPQVPMDDNEAIEAYLKTETKIEKKGDAITADGFNAAFCLGTYCVGFASESFWDNPPFLIHVSSNGYQEQHQWYCVSRSEHINSNTFQTWLEQFLPINLQETTLSPDEKKIELQQHHGVDILTEHAAKLIKSPYVEGILTSLEFNVNTKSYVYKQSDFAKGLIDVVLFWTDCHYSMRVKTTGRNIRETKRIAEILTEKYGHGKR